MRRALAVVALAGLAALLHAPEVWAGAGQAGDRATGKISGPAVSATVVINPTVVSPTGTKGRPRSDSRRGRCSQARSFSTPRQRELSRHGLDSRVRFRRWSQTPDATDTGLLEDR